MSKRVAIVTGAGSGIGLALSRQLAKSDVAIVAVGRTESRLQALVDECAGRSEIAILAADVTKTDTPSRTVALAMERFGRLDYLVNNAGIGKPSPLDETDDALLDLFLDVHLRAPFRFCREAVAAMTNGGAIVNVASTAAVIGIMHAAAYSAAKAGVIGLSRHMAAQYGRRGIRTNVVAPGVLETPMTDHAWSTSRFRRMNFDMTPLDRTGTAEDAAAAIAFLLSDAARFITGQVLVVDGGWSSTKFLSDQVASADLS